MFGFDLTTEAIIISNGFIFLLVAFLFIEVIKYYSKIYKQHYTDNTLKKEFSILFIISSILGLAVLVYGMFLSLYILDYIDHVIPIIIIVIVSLYMGYGVILKAKGLFGLFFLINSIGQHGEGNGNSFINFGFVLVVLTATMYIIFLGYYTLSLVFF